MNLRSKRFLLMCVYTVIFGVVVFVKPDIVATITPYAYGLAGAYIIGESWRPTDGNSP